MKREKRKHPAQIPSTKAVKPNREVLKRFFDNESPIQEVQTVHEWFATAQGQKYVSKELDKDFKLLDASSELEHTSEDKVDSAKFFNRILKVISQKYSKE